MTVTDNIKSIACCLLFLLFASEIALAQSNLIQRLEDDKLSLKNDKTAPVNSPEDTLAVPLLDTDNLPDIPSDDLYNSIWTRERLNPYNTPADSLPDTVRIDVSGFVFPVPGRVTSHYGPRWGRMHRGTDIDLETGDSVVSAFAGKVRIIDYEPRGYGHYIVIRHQNGLETVYAHLSRTLAVENQDVAAGEVIALGGSTGRSTGSHLHFEFRYLGNDIDTEHIVNYATKVMLADTLVLTREKLRNYQAQSRTVASAGRYYTIRRGDTLSRIAARYGTTVSRLTRLNGISVNTKLREGKRLRVR